MVKLYEVAGELGCISAEMACGLAALRVITDVMWDEFKAEEEKLQHTCFGKRFEMLFDATNFAINGIYDLREKIDAQEDVLIEAHKNLRGVINHE